MAQREQDREDLLREVTALTVRAELKVHGFEENVVIGFRAGGAACVFIGGDPVYQFNSNDELRRGFRDGNLIKAVDGKLFSMRRERKDGQVQLLRSELSSEETADYFVALRQHLDMLSKRLAAGEFDLIGQVPSDDDVVSRIIAWLASLPQEIQVAAKPNVG